MHNLPEWMIDVATIAAYMTLAALVLAAIALYLSLRGLTERDDEARERDADDILTAKRPPRVR